MLSASSVRVATAAAMRVCWKWSAYPSIQTRERIGNWEHQPPKHHLALNGLQQRNFLKPNAI